MTYNQKHNLANGEGNRDGCNENLSWNCGVEGESDDPEIRALRRRQARNLIAILLLSHGLPMLCAGDEVLRTQRGNNNCYCQDNELSWFDWSLVEKNNDMLRFVREMIRFRKRHPCLMRRHFMRGTRQPGLRRPDIVWHGAELERPPWVAANDILAYTLGGGGREEDLHVAMNNTSRPCAVALPPASGRKWHLAIDTAAAPLADILSPAAQRPFTGRRARLAPMSVVVFESRA